MSAKIINYSARKAEALADEFITEMIEETGCSFKFLNEARSGIVRLFSNTTGEALDNGLVVIKKIIENQALIEKCCEQALSSLEKRDLFNVHFNSERITQTV